jgi:hypothetical protein
MQLAHAGSPLAFGRIVSDLVQVAFRYILNVLNASVEKVKVAAVP